MPISLSFVIFITFGRAFTGVFTFTLRRIGPIAIFTIAFKTDLT